MSLKVIGKEPFISCWRGCCKLAKGVAKKSEQKRAWLSIYVSRTNGNLFFFHLKLEGFPTSQSNTFARRFFSPGYCFKGIPPRLIPHSAQGWADPGLNKPLKEALYKTNAVRISKPRSKI